MTLSTLYCVCLLALLLALATTPVSGADVKKKRGPVPPGGACVNEGDFSTGNHCVHMRGAELDLASLASVRGFRARLRAAKVARLDVLLNNAGVMAIPERLATRDGFERQIGVNHLGHFALVASVLPMLRRASNGSARRACVVRCDFRVQKGAIGQVLFTVIRCGIANSEGTDPSQGTQRTGVSAQVPHRQRGVLGPPHPEPAGLPDGAGARAEGLNFTF